VFGQLVDVDKVGVPEEATAVLRALEPDRDLVLILSDDSAPSTVNANLAPVSTAQGLHGRQRMGEVAGPCREWTGSADGRHGPWQAGGMRGFPGSADG
jgi:hypothetical protein